MGGLNHGFQLAWYRGLVQTGHQGKNTS